MSAFHTARSAALGEMSEQVNSGGAVLTSENFAVRVLIGVHISAIKIICDFPQSLHTNAVIIILSRLRPFSQPCNIIQLY
jgi:hypothetical protein